MKTQCQVVGRPQWLCRGRKTNSQPCAAPAQVRWDRRAGVSASAPLHPSLRLRASSLCAPGRWEQYCTMGGVSSNLCGCLWGVRGTGNCLTCLPSSTRGSSQSQRQRRIPLSSPPGLVSVPLFLMLVPVFFPTDQHHPPLQVWAWHLAQSQDVH